MKKLFVFLFIFVCFKAKAQHDATDQIYSPNWEIIGDVNFKTVKPTEMYAIYSSDIKKHENKAFELEGYIVPIKDGMKQSKFMLSTLPINQCYFCGKNGVPIMVMVEMAEPIKFTYIPVVIKGILKLNKGNAANNPPLVLTDAKLSK